MGNEFQKAFKGIDSAIKTGTSRALNRALSSTATELVKNLGQDTGLKAALIKTRVLQVKAKSSKLSVQIAIATKVGVSLGEFSPLPKTVNVVHQGNALPTQHVGVTVRIAGDRQLVPGAWLYTASSGKQIVLARKGAAQHPVVTLRSNAFSDAAIARTAETNTKLADNFTAQISDQLDYAIQSKFDSDR